MTAAEHAILVAAIRAQLGRERDLTLFANRVGRAKFGQRVVPFGLGEGSADIVGILSPHGRWFCLEVKTGNARRTAKQKMFAELIQKRGGFCCEARSVTEAWRALARARLGESE